MRRVAITQRDTNFYKFWNEAATQEQVVSAVKDFWEKNIKPKWTAQPDCQYENLVLPSTLLKQLFSDIFDFLLTRDLSRGHIVDFNPYAPKTDPLLFTYEELAKVHEESQEDQPPHLRVIDSASHPASNVNAPEHQHNMVPFEALQMSSGRNIHEFSDLWEESIKESMQDDDG